VGELADQGVDLLEAERQRRSVRERLAHEAIGREVQGQGLGADLVDDRGAVLAGEREHALDAADAGLLFPAVDRPAQGADVAPGAVGAAEQGLGRGRCRPRPVLLLHAPAARLLAHVLA
jgi:hypothetical protein